MPSSYLTWNSIPQRGDFQIINASSLTLYLTLSPRAFYRHGWQSWSLTAWTDPARRLPVMKPTSFHSRQTDPVYARMPHPNGSWLGAVEFAGNDILLMGALGLEAHVALRDGQLQGWYESGGGEWLLARGTEREVFTRYTDLLGERFGRSPRKTPPRVWCSWYSLHNAIREENLLAALEGLGDLPFDVFQVDDGWQRDTGDWDPNEKFPSGMVSLAAKIQASGRQAGLWLAPLAVAKSSSLYRDHPEWLLHNPDGELVRAGFEWSSETFALDTTHPQALEWLRMLIRKVRGWGYEYLKLDFLSAGALPGKRHADVPRETAYRQALGTIREAAGDAYLLLCGTPILPALGLCDAIRVGADVADHWDSPFYSYLLYNQTAPGVQNGIRTSVNRLWLQPLVHPDPDVVFFAENSSLTSEEKQLLLDLAHICGVKATSDLPSSWNESQRSAVRLWLASSAAVHRMGRYTFQIDGRPLDFSPAMPLPPIPRYFSAVLGEVAGWLGNQLWILKLWHWLFRYG